MAPRSACRSKCSVKDRRRPAETLFRRDGPLEQLAKRLGNRRSGIRYRTHVAEVAGSPGGFALGGEGRVTGSAAGPRTGQRGAHRGGGRPRVGRWPRSRLRSRRSAGRRRWRCTKRGRPARRTQGRACRAGNALATSRRHPSHRARTLSRGTGSSCGVVEPPSARAAPRAGRPARSAGPVAWRLSKGRGCAAVDVRTPARPTGRSSSHQRERSSRPPPAPISPRPPPLFPRAGDADQAVLTSTGHR